MNEQHWIRSSILDYIVSILIGKVRSVQEMNCWHCNTELIWGGDHDAEAYGCEDQYAFVTNLHCPVCESYVEVYYPNRDE
tara:strand:+ start:100 stop:339 length:240 start_codon:yes stop_codon:yes gene_type:complete